MESNCFSIEDLRIDGLPSGKLFCASVCPSFSWRMISLYPGTMQEDYPSWLFSVNQGATTMWERWNSYTVKDGFGDVNMNSFNHYAYGAVHEWVMRHICGIQLTAPGGKEICFAIEPDTRLGFVKSSLITPYGKVESNWKVADDKIIWHISAPANTRICVKIPKGYYCDNATEKLPCGDYDLTLEATGKNAPFYRSKRGHFDSFQEF